MGNEREEKKNIHEDRDNYEVDWCRNRKADVTGFGEGEEFSLCSSF